MNDIKSKAIRFSAEAHLIPFREMVSQRDDHHPLLALSLVGAYKVISKGLIPAIGHSLKGTYKNAGYEQIVYDIGNGELAKVMLASIGSTSEASEEMSAKTQALSDKAKQYLGEYWMDTTFYPAKLPRYLGGYVVVAVQADARPAKSFNTPQEVIDYSDDEDYLGGIARLAGKIEDLNSATGMYPDLFGSGNVVLAENGSDLLIVDTIPETPQKLEASFAEGLKRRDVHREVVARWGLYTKSVIELTQFPEPAHH